MNLSPQFSQVVQDLVQKSGEALNATAGEEAVAELRETCGAIDLNLRELRHALGSLPPDDASGRADEIRRRVKDLEERLGNREIAMRAQFDQMETLLSQFQSQGKFISNQLAQLSKIPGK